MKKTSMEQQNVALVCDLVLRKKLQTSHRSENIRYSFWFAKVRQLVKATDLVLIPSRGQICTLFRCAACNHS